jgi:hypothetical protein
VSDHSRCRVCDEPLPPGTTFCARCGTRVETDDDALTGLVVDDPTAAGAVSAGADPTQPVPRAVVAPTAAAGTGLPPEDDGRSDTVRWLVIALVAVIVIALIALIVVAVTRDDDKNPPASTTTSASTTTTSIPTTSVPVTTLPTTTAPPPTEPPPTEPPPTTPTTVPPTTPTTVPPTSST